MSNSKITLSIESAIAGGSISLIGATGEIANWIGDSTDNRAAEDLLPTIDRMLADNHIDRRDINLIAVSAGPGSFTGIRIGLATAMGLKFGWGIPMACASALVAIASSIATDKALTVAVPAGRRGVCWQQFSDGQREARSEPVATSDDELEKLSNDDGSVLVVHSTLASRLPPSPRLIDFGQNVAYAVGLHCIRSGGIAEPLFLSRS